MKRDPTSQTPTNRQNGADRKGRPGPLGSQRRGLLGRALLLFLSGCSAVPTRSVDCDTLGKCEPLRFVLGQPDEFSNNRLRLGLSGPLHALVAGGSLFVADSGHNRVLVWRTFPPSYNQPPDAVLGQPDLTTSQVNYGGLSSRSLSYPASLASDGTRLAVVDGGNGRILIWNTLPMTNYARADVVLGQRDFVSALPPSPVSAQTIGAAAMPVAATGTILYPGVHFATKAGGGSLLIATDPSAHRILTWDPAPTATTSATAALGQADFMSASAATVSGRYSAPSGNPAMDGTLLAIADSQNHRVVLLNNPPTTGTTTPPGNTFLGQKDGVSGQPNQGLAAPTKATLNLPLGLSLQGKRLLVSDGGNNRVLVWNDATLASGGDADLVLGQTRFDSAAVGPVSASSLATPRSVQTANGITVVADSGNHRILYWAQPLTTIGQAADGVVGQASFAQNQIAASPTFSATEMNSPTGLCADGTFLVSDVHAHRVLVYPHPPYERGDAPSLVLGQGSFTSALPQQGGLSMASLQSPVSVGCKAGYVAVADRGNHRVLLWTQPPSRNTQPADIVLGQPGATTNDANHGGPARGMNSPAAVHIGDGKLIVADTGNHRVLIWNRIGAAGPTQPTPDLVLGQTDAMSVQPNGGQAGPTASTLRSPAGLFHDGTQLFVADTGNRRVLIYREPINRPGQPADVVIGQANFTSATVTAASPTSLGAPLGIASVEGRLYIADADHNRVLLYRTIPTENGQGADVALGQADLFGRQANDGGLRLDRLQAPTGVLATRETVVIADSGNGRLVVVPAP